MQTQMTPKAGEPRHIVQDIFTRVAPYYDRMNDVASLGWHRHWKRHMCARMQLQARKACRVIDMACGSGDIALACAEQAHSDSHIYGLDANQSMLHLAEARASQHAVAATLEFHCAPAECVPLDDATADIYAVAFGIRNFQARDAALREAYRLLQTGGHFLCLEFTPIRNTLWQQLAGIWTDQAVPRLGAMIAQDKPSYAYLRDSIRRFPAPQAFADALRQAGFAHIRWTLLGGGVVALHEGWKL